ncbi:MAG: tetratricopeptide repeat protein, partial [Desulfobacterales bacterium]|nr:tetratricopeptide repeat protein [Desulfobacterales bacterium]
MEKREINHIGYRHHIVLCASLMFLLLLPYLQVRHHEFVDFDDYLYIVDNPYINDGISVDGLIWAFNFRDNDKYYWRPLAWVSHMLDFELFGPDAGWHHLINVLLHLTNTLCLYVLLFAMTGRARRAALVAALFALHPINVESVAWVTERSNVLSTTAGLITLLLYVRYTRQPSRNRYLSVFFSFLLCLLVKPILVTLPFLMILLDLWPLNRFDARSTPRFAPPRPVRMIIVEKIPLIFLTGFAIWLSLQRLGSVDSTQPVAVTLRLANAVVAYVQYLINLLYPVNLAAFYPFPKSIPMWKTVGALLVLAAISGMVVARVKKKPYLFVGWFWFTGTLFPTCGLVQAGLWPELADRWAYFPAIGLFLLVVWWGMDFAERLSGTMRKLALVPVVTVAMAMAVVTWGQIGHWTNSIRLFERMLAKTHANAVAHNNLGTSLIKKGQSDKARQHFLSAIEINPGFAMAYFNLGKIARDNGETTKAIGWYEKAIGVQPNIYPVHIALGNAYFKIDNFTQSWHHYAEAIRIDPDGGALPFNGLGGILAKTGQLDKAAQMFQKALEIEPDYKPAKQNLERVTSALRTERQG